MVTAIVIALTVIIISVLIIIFALVKASGEADMKIELMRLKEQRREKDE